MTARDALIARAVTLVERIERHKADHADEPPNDANEFWTLLICEDFIRDFLAAHDVVEGRSDATASK